MKNEPLIAEYDPSLHVRIVATHELVYEALGGQRRVRTGSGLAFLDGRMLLIECDDDMMAVIRPETGRIRGLPLTIHGAARTQTRGLRGLDLEAMVATEDGRGKILLAFGSGSAPERRVVARVRLEGGANELSIHETPAFYQALDELPGFAASQLDLSGVAMLRGARLRLFHRGCGPSRGDAEALPATVDLPLDAFIFYLERCRRDPDAPFDAGLLRDLRRYDLGAIEGVPVGFTDAAGLPSGQVAFVGAAKEGREYGKEYGPYVGSILGVIAADGSVRYTMIREMDGSETRRCGDGLAMLGADRGYFVFGEFGDEPALLCDMEVRGL